MVFVFKLLFSPLGHLRKSLCGNNGGKTFFLRVVYFFFLVGQFTSQKSVICTMLWVPHEEHVFVAAHALNTDRLHDLSHLDSVNVEWENGEEISFPKASTHPVDPSHLLDLDDLCDMNSLHEAPLLDILKRRLRKDKIYTYIGNFLVSLNPYKTIHGLYDDPLRYLDKSGDGDRRKSKLSPHVYAVANDALGDLVRKRKDNDIYKSNRNSTNPHDCNQSIIITGESGAGKTEASKVTNRRRVPFKLTPSHSHSHSHRLLST